MKIWLKVQPEDAPQVQSLGGVWDNTQKKWFYMARDLHNLHPFQRWIDMDSPANIKKFNTAAQVLIRKNQPPPPANAPTEKSLMKARKREEERRLRRKKRAKQSERKLLARFAKS